MSHHFTHLALQLQLYFLKCHMLQVEEYVYKGPQRFNNNSAIVLNNLNHVEGKIEYTTLVQG